ncbi:hypothetical protein V6N13_119921 [Hibiscus sabdariffa]|uniref:Cellulose synthase n=1 Tax=Hibiscus sabdariffa TaxID=183260 RepID=A0ABR2E2P9_9ROSI
MMESGVPVCHICGGHRGLNANGEPFVACHDCNFPICKTCFEYELKEGRKACPRCGNPYDGIHTLTGSPQDDGATMLTFESLVETTEFARKWVPFCKKLSIEPRAPEFYFSQKIDYLKDKVQPSFVKERRAMKKTPEEGRTMQDGTPWPENNTRDHPGMIQVRVSAVLTNAPFILNRDCDHYVIVNNSKAVREAMCFLMDPQVGRDVVFSIGKHFMDMDHLQCPVFPSPLPHHAHGMAAARVGSLLKIHQSFIKMQKGKNLMLPSSTLGRLKLSNLASVLFLGLFLSIIMTAVFELRWSGVSIEDLWRNEQFRVIGGVSAHLFAVFQGFLKMLAGIDTNFTVTAKAAEDAEFGELYIVKWTTLLIPPTWLVWLLDSPMHSTKGMKLGVHILAKSFSPSGLSSISILSSKA